MSGLVWRRLGIGLRMESSRKLFGQNVARLADREGFSRKGLADSLGIKQQMVSRWISGKTLPTKHLDGIAKYFKVPVKELFAEPKDPLPDPPQSILPDPIEALKVLALDYGYLLRIKPKTQMGK